MQNITIIRGVPGSGKSAIADQIWHNPDESLYDSNEYFMKGGRYEFDVDKLPEAHEYCIQGAKDALNKGWNAIVVSTFIHKWEMWPYEILAQRYGASITVITAKGNFKNIHGVPEHVVNRMKTEFEE